MRILTNLYFFVLLLFVASCSNNEQSSKKQSLTNEHAKHIAYYTKGFITAQSDIKLSLRNAVEIADAGQEVSGDVFDFNPSIEGKAYWEDDRTIVFKPEGKLISGQAYQASFDLSDFVSEELDDSKFSFEFKCIPQNYDMVIEGMSIYNELILDTVKIKGYVQTADVADNEAIESMIQAKQNGKALGITFYHGVGQNRHNFVIEKVLRKDSKQEVLISWDGKSLGVDKADELTYEIPSLNDFEVNSVKIVRSGVHYISILFSDPIDDKQKLDGLIRLSKGGTPRLVASLNEVKVYPKSTIMGVAEVTIDKGIKNIAGYNLKAEGKYSVRFSQNKPEVKITANKGVVMPSSEGLIIPFEAVSLSHVDLEIVELFENNMLQYLQNNKLGGNYQIKRVGRPILVKKIDLSDAGVSDLGSWNHFTVDLAKIINVNPGSFYQVRFKFKKRYSLYACAEGEDDVVEEEENWDAIEEDTNWDNYEDYYYDWENRDNPCHVAYYSSNRMPNKIVFGTNIGIVAKRADQGDLHVFCTDLVSAKELSGVAVEVYDFQQQLIGEGKTDGEGKTAVNFKGHPSFIITKKDKQVSYLKIDDGSSLSLSNFDVTGAKIQKGIKGFVYGERGVWRPGDTLYVSVMIEDKQKVLPPNHPVVLELYNPMGQLYTRSVQALGEKGLNTFVLSTSPDAPTGNWQAKAKIGKITFSKQLKIETVKPNRLKINLDFDQKVFTKGEHVKANLDVKWLHGAIARNLKTVYEVMFTPVPTRFEGYGNFIFDDPSKDFHSESSVVYEGRLDENGHADVSCQLNAGSNAPGMLNAVFKGKVFEEGGDFSIDKTTVKYMPYESFVGIQLPEGDKRGMLTTDVDHAVQVVTLNGKGKPVSRDELKVEVYKLNWRWWWDNSWEDKSNYTHSYYSRRIKEETISSSNGKGVYQLNIKYSDWGRYLVKVTDVESGHSTGKIVYIDWPGWAGKQRGELGGASMLSFEVAENKVAVGDKIKLNVPSSKGGNILVSIESGSSLIQSFWVKTKDKNTPIEFKATSAMAPNIYVHLSLIQPHAQSSNDLPIRMYGVESIKVRDEATVLEPIIDMPEKLEPGQTFNVKVSEANGKPMTYTLAIVEDGLLDLTKFKTPKPHGTFYAKEALGVKTWDLFDDVMGAYGGELEKLLAVGGDGEVLSADEKETNRFKPVVLFKGPLTLGKGDKETLSFTMPQYVGSVRVMLVAGYNGKYGSSEKTIPVKQPLMALATLPRMVGPSEEILLPVNIFTTEDDIKKVNVQVKVNDKLIVDGSNTQILTFSKSSDKYAYFKLKSKAEIGKATVQVTATSGRLKAKYDVELMVRPSNPLLTNVVDKLMKSGQESIFAYDALGVKGTNNATVELSTLPPLNLDQRLNYLIHYPHGCIEQTTSSVFAQLYLDDFVALSKKRAEEVQRNINAAIERLRLFQTSAGGFSYWPGQSDISSWGTNYAGHFLLEARNKGFFVPEDMITKWVAYQQETANNWDAGTDHDLQQAYRLYGLALSGNSALGAMNRLKENVSLSVSANWMLALAYTAAGYADVAAQLIDGKAMSIEKYNEQGNTYGSSLRDEAIILTTLVKLNRQEEAFKLTEMIAQHLSDTKQWMSTQTTAYCLIGIGEFVKQFKPGVNGAVEVFVDGKKFKLNAEDKYLSQLVLVNPDEGSEIKVKNNSDAPLYARLITSGVPIEGSENSHESNIKLKISYVDLKGNAIDVTNLKQGTDFVAHVTVTNPGTKGNYEELSLTQMFPAGWEIINTRLDETEGSYGGNKPEYQDIRDDRVLSYFDLKRDKSMTIHIPLNASYQGKYYLPAIITGAMYDNNITANTKGKWVHVVAND